MFTKSFALLRFTPLRSTCSGRDLLSFERAKESKQRKLRRDDIRRQKLRLGWPRNAVNPIDILLLCDLIPGFQRILPVVPRLTTLRFVRAGQARIARHNLRLAFVWLVSYAPPFRI